MKKEVIELLKENGLSTAVRNDIELLKQNGLEIHCNKYFTKNNRIAAKLHEGRFFVFSTNIPPFECSKSYTYNEVVNLLKNT